MKIITHETLVIGTGCAGFNAADTLYDLGRTDVAIVTEGVNMGTSRNTGSDKQTYYKLSLASDGQDSVSEMAQTLHAGGSVNGDHALIEASTSVRAFMKLVNLGVPFPTNDYGEYVGYKTDHDPRQRATSCGPLTSKLMTEKLEASVNRKGIRIYDKIQVVKFLTVDGRIDGALAVVKETGEFVLFNVSNIVMATGGPAGIYWTSVYPGSQTGMTGMALEAGAKASNLNEWQYGLASIKFRWNVSGTYQQVLPKYIAVDKNGCEREFLPEYFDDPKKALDMVFLKGYQWPFDVRKIGGSSVIDLIIHHEIFDLGNRVYMDFRSEPKGLENGFEGLAEETYNYLKRSNALIKTPIARLAHMNTKSIELYKDNGIDLYAEPLEVSVCAQHNNGGVAVDMHWESCVKGLFVVGEAAGTFGVYRPGGSALNSTQVGSLRAAEHIAYDTPKKAKELSQSSITAAEAFAAKVYACVQPGGETALKDERTLLQKKMSESASHIRSREAIKELISELEQKLAGYFDRSRVASKEKVAFLLKNRDILITQLAVLSSMQLGVSEIGSRGSGLVIDEKGEPINDRLDYRYVPGKDGFDQKFVATCFANGVASSKFEATRPMPRPDDWFENVWNAYNKRIGI